MNSLYEKHQEYFIHSADLKRYFKKRKHFYLLVGGICSALTLVGLLALEPQYVLQASFKEATMRGETSSASMLRTLLKGPGNVELGTQALSIMKSRQLLQKVIEDQGLQGAIKARHFARRFDPLPSYRVVQAKYLGKQTRRFYLHRMESGKVEVYSREEKTRYQQDPHQKFIFQDLEFFLEEGEGQVGQTFLMEFYPMELVLDAVVRKFKVKVRREDPSILDLTYKDRDPKRGASFLNHVMAEYKQYLVKDNARIAREQLCYLTARQSEIANELDGTLHKHAEYLQATLGDKGFMGLHQELEMIENKKKRHQQRLLEIDLDMNKLDRMKSQKMLFSLQEDSMGQEEKQHLLRLKKQKDGLDLATLKRTSGFSKRGKKKISTPILSVGFQDHMLKNLEDKEDQIEKNSTLPIFMTLRQKLMKLHWKKDKEEKAFNENTSYEYQQISLLKKEAEEQLVRAPQEKREALSHRIYLLSLREKILEQRLQEEKMLPKELEGIDLEMAKSLHSEYIHEFDEKRLKRRQLELALDHLQKDNCEISSLIGLVEDPIGQEKLRELSELFSEFKSGKYLSDKDRIRLKEHLLRKKDILKDHLEQMTKISSLHLKIAEEKLISLQQVTSDLVNQDIAIIERQMEQLLQEKCESLRIEKKSIQEKLQELQQEMKEIPRKWLIENRLQLQADLNVSMMEGMAQLVESKNIEHHLLQVESKPIDEAYMPLKPKQHPLFLYVVLGGCLGVVIAIGIGVVVRVSRGFPLSLEGLKLYDQSVAGPFLQQPSFENVQNIREDHLEILRKGIAFLLQETSLVAAIILNGLANYAGALGVLFVLSGKKTLVIELTPSKEEGLVEYLLGTHDVIIQQRQGVHVLPLGNDPSYRMEMLNGLKFMELLEELQKVYEVILLVTDKKVTSSEARKLCEFSQKNIVTLDEESFDHLYPYMRRSSTLYLAFE